jgi:prolyl-tRNA synthetase
LFKNAKNLLDENMQRVQTIDEAKERKGIIEIPWCGNEDCAMEVENILEGNTLGEPIDKEVCNHACPVCGMAAKTWMRFAKTY